MQGPGQVLNLDSTSPSPAWISFREQRCASSSYLYSERITAESGLTNIIATTTLIDAVRTFRIGACRFASTCLGRRKNNQLAVCVIRKRDPVSQGNVPSDRILPDAFLHLIRQRVLYLAFGDAGSDMRQYRARHFGSSANDIHAT